jgi:hypothetical protein
VLFVRVWEYIGEEHKKRFLCSSNEGRLSFLPEK